MFDVVVVVVVVVVLGTKGVDQVGLIATRKVRSRPGQIAGPNNLTSS